VEKDLERTSFAGALSKIVSPSGSGQINESERLTVEIGEYKEPEERPQ